MSEHKQKCSKCGKVCSGTLCMSCFRKNRRIGQLSRVRGLKKK